MRRRRKPWSRRPLGCKFGFHDWYFYGLPPMAGVCRRCGVRR